MQNLARIALAACLFVSLAARATELPEMYSASVEVLDQSTEQRTVGFRNALAQVLVRVSGDREINSWNDTDALLARAPQLIQRYSYEEIELPTSPEPPTVDTDVQAQYRLQAVFDGRAVLRAIRESGLPVWGPSRPRHLLWLALRDDGSPRGLIDQDSARDRAATVLETASQRGLPINFPLLDLEDRRMLDFADVWGGFSSRILGASQRYDTPQIVTAAIGREGRLWNGHFTLLNADGPVDSWVVTEINMDRVMAQGMHILADRQAARMAVVSDGFLQALALRVSGIASLYDYGRVLNHLEALNAVKEVQVAELNTQDVLFRLRIEGDRESLQRAVELGRLLAADQLLNEFGLPSISNELGYKLVR